MRESPRRYTTAATALVVGLLTAAFCLWGTARSGSQPLAATGIHAAVGHGHGEARPGGLNPLRAVEPPNTQVPLTLDWAVGGAALLFMGLLRWRSWRTPRRRARTRSRGRSPPVVLV